jgi:carbon storage regulator
MLMLVRKKNESIVIGEHIVVTVIGIYGDKVRLGIDAPQEMAVHRREIYEAIKRGEVPKEENAASDQ